MHVRLSYNSLAGLRTLYHGQLQVCNPFADKNFKVNELMGKIRGWLRALAIHA